MSVRRKILIMDDDAGIRLLLGKLLEKNYEIITKANGWEAMEAMENGLVPDLILLDMQMPGLNGLSFLLNIRKSGLFRNVPVIVISGSVSEKVVKECFAIGINCFFSKPFDPQSLIKEIHSLLAPKTAEV